MKSLKKYMIALLVVALTVPSCRAAEEAEKTDRLKAAYDRKLATPIDGQLEQLDGLVRQAIAADRPLILAFGANRLEISHFNFSGYTNLFVIYIQDYVMNIPHDEEQYILEWSLSSTRALYKTSIGDTSDTVPSDDVLKDFCISELEHPSLIASDILDPHFYAGLSARYAGRFDLITTDLGVTEKFDFTKDALSHYTRLLKKDGVMAFDCHRYGFSLQEAVKGAFMEAKGIKTFRKYITENLKADCDQLCGRADKSTYSAEERSSIWQQWDAFAEDLRKNRKVFNPEVFIEKVIEHTLREYENHEQRWSEKVGEKVPTALYFGSSFWSMIGAALEEDEEEYKLLTAEIDAQNSIEDANTPIKRWKSAMNDYYMTSFSSFFSQEIFADYTIEKRCGMLAYVTKEKHHTGNLDYIYIQRK